MNFESHIEVSRFGNDTNVNGYVKVIGEDSSFTLVSASADAYADDAGSIREAMANVNAQLRGAASTYARLAKAKNLLPEPLPEYTVVEVFEA